ncbi:DUF4397 domain-containing protein [Mucilaginibacter antarcticus]|uniref:DUF4397 domain-containing protein n=1 Tax=Mucilaginibacter antarcticus TaxID=1855725 RepID=UPI003642E670
MKTIQFHKAKFIIALGAIALFSAGLSSCKKDKDAEPSAYIMATNSAEGSTSQDFTVDDNKTNVNALAYTQATTYTPVKVGDHQLQFKSSGTATVNSTASLNTEAGNYYSVFYLDDKSTVTLKDDQTDPQPGKHVCALLI